MVEKIEVRTTSGGFIEVTRCEEGVVWVDIKRGDGTTGISGRLDGFGPSDLAKALAPDMAALAEIGRWEPRALHAEKLLKETLESAGHGAYQKLNDQLAKAKAEVASLQGQVVGRGAALETWKREAELRAEDHERLTAVAKVLGCPLYHVVARAESFVKEYEGLRATVADGDARSEGTSETWKQRDARHRETIHQLKQENANFRRNANAGREERDALKRQIQTLRPSPVNPPVSPAEAAHVMSLTKQLEEARNDVKATQKEVYELKLAGKICAEAMQEWRSKLTSVCGFTFPNLVNLSDIVRQICTWRDAPEKNVTRVKQERDDLQAKVDTWRKELTEVLEFSKPPYFDHFITKIRELKVAAAETRLVNDDATHVRQQFKAASVQWDQAAANFNRTINELRALASTESEVRKALENKHREWMAIKADHAKMLELRRGDQETVKRCSDRVKELEARAREATAALEGRKS